MKKTLPVFVVFIFSFYACTQLVKGKNGVVYSSAITYNDYIVNRQSEIMKMIFQLSEEAKTDLGRAEETLDSAISLVDKEIIAVEGMPDWKGNTALRDNALALFRFYKTFFGDYYRNIIKIQKDGEVTAAEQEEYASIMEKINSTEGRLDTNFQKAQQDFSAKNGIQIKKNEL